MVAHATFHWSLDTPLDAKEAGALLGGASGAPLAPLIGGQ
jgi:hypothetical protein